MLAIRAFLQEKPRAHSAPTPRHRVGEFHRLTSNGYYSPAEKTVRDKCCMCETVLKRGDCPRKGCGRNTFVSLAFLRIQGRDVEWPEAAA